MNIIETLAQEMSLTTDQVEKTVALIDEGNTIPFIARYRKEVTGSLDDSVLRTLDERLTALRNLEKRKEASLPGVRTMPLGASGVLSAPHSGQMVTPASSWALHFLHSIKIPLSSGPSPEH